MSYPNAKSKNQDLIGQQFKCLQIFGESILLGMGGGSSPCFASKEGESLENRETDSESVNFGEGSRRKGWIDIHAHILPGVDDGAEDWKTAVRMLEMSYEQGVRCIIATPHYSSRQKLERVREVHRQLDEAAREISGNFHIKLGQEIMYFEGLPSCLEAGEALTLAGSRYVLVEFRPDDNYGKISRAVHQLVQSSYFPVIAHAERYRCLRDSEKMAEMVKDGAYIQMNAGSLEGGLLDRKASWCRKEVLKGQVHFLATDMHGTGRRPPNLEHAVSWAVKQGGLRLARRLMSHNQMHILEDTVL